MDKLYIVDFMKIIISRKGFDDQYGGFPSPILPTGKLLSLPIADQKDNICYSALKLDGYCNYFELITQLKGKYHDPEGWHNIEPSTKCHLDPDIYRGIYHRKEGWKPAFGQVDAAQSHLKNQEVKEDDLFLFFGSFRKTELNADGHLKFIKKEKPKYIIFGYLQIGEILKSDEHYECPDWLEYHPHNHERTRKSKNNTIYVARDTLTLNPNLKGSGTFKYDDRLVLTKDSHSKSKWKLSDIFKKVKISCHTENCWKQEGYFQSNAIGQEFVVETDYNIDRWVKELFQVCDVI